MHPQKLKICFVAGVLTQGGAERQLLYWARALKALGVDVRVCCPYRGEHYQSALEAENIPVIWIGQSSSHAGRLVRLASYLARFQPHIIQAVHFHMNLPTNVLGRLLGAVSIAASRSDIEREIEVSKPWGIWGVRTAATLVTNSKASMDKAIRLGVAPGRVAFLSNVIDLKTFDGMSLDKTCTLTPADGIWAGAVGTIGRAKRFERFLQALASARVHEPRLKGFLVGDGPDRDSLHALAMSLGLDSSQFRFLGRRNDVPALLKQASIYVLSSEREGMPNVVLEAMAARLPIVTTPAGDAARLVKAADAGFVVDHDDIGGMAACLGALAKSRELRTRFGNNGRSYVERHHDASTFGATLLNTYRLIAESQNAPRTLAVLKQF